MKNYNSDIISWQVKSFTFTQSMIKQELNGIFGSQVLNDMKELLALYNIYEEGADFDPDNTSGDYIPADHHFKIIRSIIDKEARFLFSQPPTVTLVDTQGQQKDEEGNLVNRLEANQNLVNKVLESNHFNSKLVRAAKDCLVGRRLAIAVDFSEKGVDISFMPAFEFIYETDPQDVDTITKFIRFYSVVENDEKGQQRIYKKKWELNEEGYCVISEGMYDGNAQLIEEIMPETVTQLTTIPCWVIINGGLIGDPFGKSDVEEIISDEEWYSKLSSKDFDSLRKGTDQIVYTIDMNPKSTNNLSRAAGSYWDLSSDPSATEKTGQVGVLDNSMSYSPALDTTLNRIRANMYAQLDVPDTTSEALTGVVSSGKTMKAIYWGLMVRCDEKLLDWMPALQGMVRMIIEGCKLFPEAKKVYTDQELVDDFTVNIENTYPILEDESEEKNTDMAEVQTQVMSRRSYMKKWRGLTDDDIDDELQRIAEEQALLSGDNYMPEEGDMEELGEEEEEFEEGSEEGEDNEDLIAMIDEMLATLDELEEE